MPLVGADIANQHFTNEMSVNAGANLLLFLSKFDCDVKKYNFYKTNKQRIREIASLMSVGYYLSITNIKI